MDAIKNIEINKHIVALQEGRVVVLQENKIFISVNGLAPIAAWVAASCLVKPQQDDIVCCWLNDKGQCYILSVLVASDSKNTSLEIEGNMQLKVAGNFSIDTNKNIDLKAAGSYNSVADKMSILATTADYKVKDSYVYSNKAFVNISSLSLIANSVSQVIKNLTQSLSQYMRNVAEVDQVNSKSMIRNASKLWSLKTRHASIKSDKNLLINSDHINMS